jgi:hypothetical protein
MACIFSGFYRKEPKPFFGFCCFFKQHPKYNPEKSPAPEIFPEKCPEKSPENLFSRGFFQYSLHSLLHLNFVAHNSCHTFFIPYRSIQITIFNVLNGFIPRPGKAGQQFPPFIQHPPLIRLLIFLQ